MPDSNTVLFAGPVTASEGIHDKVVTDDSMRMVSSSSGQDTVGHDELVTLTAHGDRDRRLVACDGAFDGVDLVVGSSRRVMDEDECGDVGRSRERDRVVDGRVTERIGDPSLRLHELRV